MIANDSSTIVECGRTSLLAYGYMQVGGREKIFLRVDSEVKQRWLKAIFHVRSDQTKLGARLVEWFVQQPPEVQSAIISSEAPSPKILQVISQMVVWGTIPSSGDVERPKIASIRDDAPRTSGRGKR